MEKLPVTVLLLTLNAEPHMEEWLVSVEPWAEDIFVLDSRSKDRTVDILLEHGVKVIQRPFSTFGEMTSYMLTKLPIRSPWVLMMAQDERVSPDLYGEMHELFRNEPPCNGYTVKWRLWFMGQPLHAMTDNLRLLRIGKCSVSQVLVNEHYMAERPIGHLRGILEHKDTLTLFDWYEKQNLYTTWEAIERIRNESEDEKPRLFGTALQRKKFFKRLCIRSFGGKFIMFWYYLLAYGAWKDGWAGLQWVKGRLWVHEVCTLKEREMRRCGVLPPPPMARHGDFDPRVMNSALQRELLPELVKMWEQRSRT